MYLPCILMLPSNKELELCNKLNMVHNTMNNQTDAIVSKEFS